jgi:hypothetical protein
MKGFTMLRNALHDNEILYASSDACTSENKVWKYELAILGVVWNTVFDSFIAINKYSINKGNN